jgi:hypothetical protein
LPEDVSEWERVAGVPLVRESLAQGLVAQEAPDVWLPEEAEPD